MNIKQLSYFCHVVESGSASAAAKRLFIAPTAISMQLVALEQELGGELLNRSSRPMSLTKLGHFFYPRAQKLLNDFHKLQSDTRAFVSLADTVLNIGFPRSVMVNLLPEAIKLFSATHSHVTLNLTEVLSEYQPERVLNQTIDIGITREFEGDCIVPKSLDHHLILVDPLFAAIHRDHYLAQKSFLTLQDFCRSPFISYPKDERSGFSQKILNYFAAQQCMPVISHRAIEIHTALALVGAGLDVTLVGKSAIPENRQDVIYLPIEDFKVNSYIYAISNPDSSGTHIHAFIEILKSIAA